MASPERLTTRVSTKGQVILPKAIRDRLNWPPGTSLVVESADNAVVLRAAPRFKPTTIDEVFGMSRRAGQRPLTVDEMDAGVLDEARRRARD